MSPNTQAKVLNYIRLSADVLNALSKQAGSKSADDAKLALVIPGVVDALVKNKRIDETERVKAAEVLMDHGKALEVLKNTAAHRGTDDVRMGQPAGVKQAAAYSSTTNPHVGSSHEESDRVWFDRLGIVS
jgi:hypothetical protein